MAQPDFKKYFDGFDDYKLSRMPREYANGFGDEELLKYKSYTVSHAVNDKMIQSPEALDYCLHILKIIKPVNDFLNRGISA